MTQLLEKAFAEASKLSEDEQNEFALWLMDEIIAEKKWETSFSQSEDFLAAMADEALEEHAQGRTKPLRPESL